MKTFSKYLALLFVAALSLSLYSCGSDDNDDQPAPPTPGQSDEIVRGSLGEGFSEYLTDYRTGPRFVFRNAMLWVDQDNGYFGSSIVYIGQVNNLSDIRTAPSSGWDESADLHNNGGYVINFTDGGVPYYVRLMITTNTNAAGGVVGINYAYQYFKPSNL